MSPSFQTDTRLKLGQSARIVLRKVYIEFQEILLLPDNSRLVLVSAHFQSLTVNPAPHKPGWKSNDVVRLISVCLTET